MGKLTTQFYECEHNQFDALIKVKEANPELANLIDDLINFYGNHGFAETYYLTDFGFDRIGHGSYKEAFQYGDYIVKFASGNNDTEREYEILQLAEKAKVYGFCPTIFASCPDILLNEIDQDNMENGDYDEYDEENDEYYYNEDHDCPYGCYILIQQKVIPLNDSNQFSYEDNIYKYDENDERWRHISDDTRYLVNAAPRIAKIFNAEDWYRLNIHNVKWIDEYDWWYNTDGLIRFKDFVINTHITDLHTGNIGIDKEGKPVIFDWLS